MKIKALLGGLVAALLIAGCSSPATDNKTTNTTSTTTTTTSNTSKAAPAANTTNTNSASAPDASSSAQGKQDFTLHNETGVEIDQLYVSPSDKNDWEEDILGRDTLPSGQSLEITFSPEEKAAKWDLKVVDKQGNSIVWEDLNLIEISEVTLRYKDGKGTAEVK